MLLQLPIKARFSNYVVNATTDVEPMHQNIKYRDDYIGKRFGNLVVIAYPVNSKGVRLGGAVCKCDCGNNIVVCSMSQLFNGTISHCKECGHKVRSEAAKKRWINSPRHSPFYEYRDERLYRVWLGMKQRCGKRPGYIDVSVCDEWLDYRVFREWAYSHGYDDKAPRGECTIDRINPFGNYEPKNCRFISLREQVKNQRKHWERLDEETRQALVETIAAGI